ncbi:hypothetical protein [Pseudomonas sp. AP-1]|uniref:hypothetical protein n=1 Tax=Pseudomonas sp. AP-1 TaxID=3231718 RepID=UPI0035B0A536
MSDKDVVEEAIRLRNQHTAEALAQCIQKHAPHIEETIEKVVKWVGDSMPKLAPVVAWAASVDWKRVQERLDNFPDVSSEAMKVASREGWFFNWLGAFDDVLVLSESIKAASSADEIDQLLTAHYNDYWDHYAGLLAEKYPARKTAIHAAVSAHRDFAPSGYSLSIPVFLAQADGIFSEVTGTPSAMDKIRGGAIKGSQWLSEQIGTDEEAIGCLVPVLQLHELDILMNQRQREAKAQETGKVFDALNRHQVMHGEVSDYGTEINSLKAFSFLLFVALHVPEILADAKRRAAEEA